MKGRSERPFKDRVEDGGQMFEAVLVWFKEGILQLELVQASGIRAVLLTLAARGLFRLRRRA